MPKLCVKVGKWGRPPTQRSNFPVYEHIQKLIKNANTIEKVNQCMKMILAEFDSKQKGVLYKDDAKRFCEKIILNMKGNGHYGMTEFEDWFVMYDQDFSGAIE
jgi:hypothetical protein